MTTAVLDFLVRAAREFRRGGWVFTGFHWPVLAGHLAHSFAGEEFTQVFEAGATLHGRPRTLPTSTTDFSAYADVCGWTGDTAGALLGLSRRYTRVVLDAANVDVTGCVNSSFLGPRTRPSVRLPGGGGSADVAARARELVWLHGGSDVRRIHHRVEHVTACPAPMAGITLHTRWGVVVLGTGPRLAQVADGPDVERFVTHLDGLGVDVSSPALCPPVSTEEREAAALVLREAAIRGYVVARRALEGD